MQSPIFIFSLPRSGSTLLQRILMTNDDISSLAEPWILLPLVYSLKREGTLSEYSSLTAFQGVSDFVRNLPNEKKDFDFCLSNFIKSLYEKQCRNGERYFLDKTPRYYLIIDEIIELFPNAKFIFLFRNPIHVLASTIDTWGNNKLDKLHRNRTDITKGFKALSQGYKNHRDKSICLKYEDLVTNPSYELDKISNYLELNIGDDALKKFSFQETKGALGDPKGVSLYSSISQEGLHKWESILNSALRKRIALFFLNKLNENDFKIQGYDKSEIIRNLSTLDNSKNLYFMNDMLDLCKSFLINKYQLNLVLRKEYSWARDKFLS